MAVHALILVEGDTEVEFYKLLSSKYFPRYPKDIKNLHGNWSINRKIIDRALAFSENNPSKQFFVCVCLDQERINVPVFDIDLIKSELIKKNVDCEIFPVIAHLMSESLFFSDIDGIYTFLRAPHAKRNPSKYSQFRRLTHKDLTHLFRQFENTYIKGRAIKNFINHLDLDKVVSSCAELKALIDKCK